MSTNTSGHRITQQKKFGTKPRWLNSKLIYRNSLRSRLYRYNTLPGYIISLNTFKLFKKHLRKHMLKNR